MKELELDLLEQMKDELQKTLRMFDDKNLDKNKFCVMPFVNIILEPNGDIGLCRHKGTEFTFGNIREKTIDEIWSSKEVINWRKDFLSNSPQVCKFELIDRKCNLCPELNKLLPYADLENTENPKILRLTANLNGRCNLECQMCHVWKLPNGFYTDENFWIPAREKFFKEIKEVDMLSGEPFIQKDTYRLIDEVSSVNESCLWTFTTNLHWNLTDEIKKNLNKINIKNIIVSIDSLDNDVFSKIRKKGNLDFAIKNLDALIEYEHERIEKGLSKLNIRLHCLIQQDNWKEAKKVIDFCLNKKIIPFLSYLYEPEQFSLSMCDYKTRVNILDFYFQNLNNQEILLTQRVIKPLLRSLNKIDYIYYLDKLKRVNDEIS